MTDPARPPAPGQTESEHPATLGPTLLRPEGSFVLPPLPPELPFAPPEVAGDLGKLGRYRVVKKLGAGGMGAVYLGADTALERRVALKVMLPQYAADPESKERFVREARAAAKVHSDHVVTIHDVGEDRGIPFIAMEYLLGYPLDRFLKTQGNPSLANVVRIGRETALGLAAAHKFGLIHRDIKPGNVWLEAPKGRVKILDFGLARAADDTESTELTGTGQVVGTPAFMSPEQARNLKLDPRSDLFSLGVMLYRLATGRMPFEGTTTMALLTSLAVDTPPAPRQLKPTIPPGLEAVINKLLAKSPDDRFQTAREVADALAAVEQQKPAAGQQPVDAAPMAISVQFEVVEDEKDESGSRARVITEPVEAAPAPARKKPARKKGEGNRAATWLLPAVYAAVCAVVAALAALLFWPSKGTLLVESDDPDAELVIKKDGAVVRDRTREREVRLRTGSYTAHLANPKPGQSVSPEKFEVTTRESARVRVALETLPPPPPPSPAPEDDRPAAEWVLRVGGAVRVAGEGGERRTKDGLPPGPFRVTRVNLSGAAEATDATLTRLRGCTALTQLHLAGCEQLTDAGLAAFAGHTNLVGFDLSGCTRVTDAGLAHLRGCKRIDHISISGCVKVTDKGLAHFRGAPLRYLSLAGCPKVTDTGLENFRGVTTLTWLDLGETAVTDAGLEHFRGCQGLGTLSLHGCARVGDAGMKHFRECEALTYLRLSGTGVTDGGMESFANCRALRTVNLSGTEVGNTGFARLAQCPNLRTVDVSGTRVSDDAVRALQNVRPNCQITHLNPRPPK